MIHHSPLLGGVSKQVLTFASTDGGAWVQELLLTFVNSPEGKLVARTWEWLCGEGALAKGAAELL